MWREHNSDLAFDPILFFFNIHLQITTVQLLKVNMALKVLDKFVNNSSQKGQITVPRKMSARLSFHNPAGGFLYYKRVRFVRRVKTSDTGLNPAVKDTIRFKVPMNDILGMKVAVEKQTKKSWLLC